ncbi:MAG: hypothetical protein C0510_08185 [Erythrobacter sp.]|nr:hypothetical protein [Erythrobacter sp.]
MKYYHMASCAALVFIGLATSAQACSVVDDYRVPTNLELAEQTPTILLARVIDEIEGETSWDRKLLVQPIEAIKGGLPEGTIEIVGSGLVPESDERGFGLLSNPYELEQAHPLSYIGGCIRYMFPKGTTALFFIGKEDGQWVPAGGPFSRWAEDVLIVDAPWLRLTRLYTSAADLPEQERAEFLGREMARLSGLADDPVAQLMAQDIARQLAGPNETWNAIMQHMIGLGPENEAAADAIAELLIGDDGEEVGDDVSVDGELSSEDSVDSKSDPRPNS